ncbi:hypothetical protein K2X85_09835 [bacterium]|nr:hypothetical protein [bacterium]
MIESARQKERWWVRWVRRAMTALLIVALLSAILVAMISALLVCDETTADWGSDIALFWGPDFDRVVELYRRDPRRRILLMEKIPARPMELKVLPPFHLHMQAKLEQAGVPASAIVLFPTEGRPEVSIFSSLKRMASEQPPRQVIVVAERLGSRRSRRFFDRLLTERPALVRIFPITTAGINESNWWYKPGGPAFVVRELIALFSNEASGP